MKEEDFRTAVGIQSRIDELTDFLKRREIECRVTFGYGGQVRIDAGPVVEAIEAELAGLREDLIALGVEVTG